MTCTRFLMSLLLASLLNQAAQAGIIFGKKKDPKPTPDKRVPELLGLVKTSNDEHARQNAAEELRKYDAQQFPDMIPTLIDVLQHDPKATVRAEAAQSLGRLRPVSQDAGGALETALAKDASMRVRLQARSSLLHYHWAGYRSKKEPVPVGPQTNEPPLAQPGTPLPVPGNVPLPQGSTPPTITPTPRPLPQSFGKKMSAPTPGVQRMPVGPSQPVTNDQGPDLGPPQ